MIWTSVENGGGPDCQTGTKLDPKKQEKTRKTEAKMDPTPQK